MEDNGWEPAIQLLEFEDGSEMLRFCVFHGKQFSRMPLLTGPDELIALFKAASKHPRISTHLRKSADQL